MYSRHKQSLQIYNKHKEFFGTTQIDLKIYDMLREQKGGENQIEEKYDSHTNRDSQMIDRNSNMFFGDGVDPDMMRGTDKLGSSLINPNQSTTDFTEAERIIADEDNRKSK